MALSFRDYVLISSAIEENQLEEGKIDDLLAWVKKMLGPKATAQQIEAKLKTLKDVDKKDIEQVKKTMASRDFHARKAADALKPKQPIRTTSHHSGIEDAKHNLAMAHKNNRLRAGQQKQGERDWMGEEMLEEAQAFVVTYKLKTGDIAKRWKVTARDAAQAKRKFGDTHYGAKLVSVEPMGGTKVPVKKIAERPAVDEDVGLLEATDKKFVQVKVGFTAVDEDGDLGKDGTATISIECKDAADAKKVAAYFNDPDASEDFSNQFEDFFDHICQNTLGDHIAEPGYIDKAKVATDAKADFKLSRDELKIK